MYGDSCYEGNRNENKLRNFLEFISSEFDVTAAFGIKRRHAISEDDGEERELPFSLEMKWEICGCCQGSGTHALHGLEITNWDEWDYDERDAYLSGDYDTACGECNCSGKIRVVDWSYYPPALEREWDLYWHEIYNMRAEMEAERRMGA